MSKTELTKQLEQCIYKATWKVGTFGCFEVTIGFNGTQRVDYITMDTKEVFRCYEIKISKSDFHSEHGHNFVGHYNYYVMPKELYEEVKEEIPKEIGVYANDKVVINAEYNIEQERFYLIKNPKRQELKADKNILKNSMIRSLSREYDKFMNYNIYQ